MRTTKGFTLMELLIIIAILGILGAIAVPRVAQVMRKSKEQTTKQALGAMRSAVAVYAAQNNKTYPQDLAVPPFIGTFIDAVPMVKLGKYHPDSAKIKIGGRLDDTGGWYYDPSNGRIVVNCTHTDTAGNPISTW